MKEKTKEMNRNVPVWMKNENTVHYYRGLLDERAKIHCPAKKKSCQQIKRHIFTVASAMPQDLFDPVLH